MEKKDKNRSVRVVIIETDRTYQKFWERIFARIDNCHADITGDTNSALHLLKKNDVDLVISEVLLPHLNGYEIAKKAHKYHPSTEVILTTSYDCDLDRFDLKNPHFSILYKPFDNIDDIERFVRHILNHEDVFSDASEDSFSENDSFPEVMEWKL